MPGTLTPSQMFDHELNPIKGWFHGHAVDKALAIADGETGINPGSVVSMDANGRWQLGLVADGVGCFAFQGQNDFDVNSDVGNISGGTLMALPCIAPYELETTEFVDGQAYTPNTLLTSPAPGAANAGSVTPGVKFVNTVCGIVTDGQLENENGIDVVRFWTAWLPTT